LLPKDKRRRPRVVIDTSVLITGISGFREPFTPGRNPSADVLHKWAEKGNFIWLITEDILDENKEVLKRLGVRRNLIGRVISLIRERAEEIKTRSSIEISPDPKDEPFCHCSEQGKGDFIVTLNPDDFPQKRLRAKIVAPAHPLA
jgi:predicted nucleic acid-binding protein